jgi:hypothetical protein
LASLSGEKSPPIECMERDETVHVWILKTLEISSRAGKMFGFVHIYLCYLRRREELVLILPPASYLSRWIPRTSPICSVGLRRYHIFYGSRPRLPVKEDSGADTCPLTLKGEDSIIVARLTVPCGPRALNIKKCLADLTMRLGSCILKVRSCVSKAPEQLWLARRVGRRYY